jgi:hypothetical protein
VTVLGLAVVLLLTLLSGIATTGTAGWGDAGLLVAKLAVFAVASLALGGFVRAPDYQVCQSVPLPGNAAVSQPGLVLHSGPAGAESGNFRRRRRFHPDDSGQGPAFAPPALTVTGARTLGVDRLSRATVCATDPGTAALPDCPVRSRVPARAVRGLWERMKGGWIDAGQIKRDANIPGFGRMTATDANHTVAGWCWRTEGGLEDHDEGPARVRTCVCL